MVLWIDDIRPAPKDGKDYIRLLCSDFPPQPAADLFRKLQPFTIGLSEKQCEGRTIKDKETGILILKDGFYNSEYGFDPDGTHDLLLF